MEIKQTFINFQDPKLELKEKIKALYNLENLEEPVSFTQATTKSMNEEGGDTDITSDFLKEMGSDGIVTATTKSMGEEGGNNVLTNSLAEIGINITYDSTTKSIGEEGGEAVTKSLEESGYDDDISFTMAIGEDGVGDVVTKSLDEIGVNININDFDYENLYNLFQDAIYNNDTATTKSLGEFGIDINNVNLNEENNYSNFYLDLMEMIENNINSGSTTKSIGEEGGS